MYCTLLVKPGVAPTPQDRFLISELITELLPV